MPPWELALRDAHSVNHNGIDDITLLWTDLPYGTGKTRVNHENSYHDHANTTYVIEAILSWLPRLNKDGTVCVCCDYRTAPQIAAAVIDVGWHYRGEIIWEFGLGRPRTSWWPVRHNNILTFTRTRDGGKFNSCAIPRAKRLAPKAGYPGDKPSGSVWEYTMSNTHSDRVGYPNQKPLELIRPFIRAHSAPGDLVADIFCGTSTTGVAAIAHGCRYYGVDNNPQAIALSRDRLLAETSRSPTI